MDTSGLHNLPVATYCMAHTNKHLIRHKAKGAGKKWRPLPGDPVLVERKKRDRTDWRDSIRDLFRG